MTDESPVYPRVMKDMSGHCTATRPSSISATTNARGLALMTLLDPSKRSRESSVVSQFEI